MGKLCCSIQLHSHQNNFLPACFSRTKSLWDSCHIHESLSFRTGNRSAIFTDYIQFQLHISGSSRTFYTGNSQSMTNSDTPKSFFNTDSKLRTMLYLIFFPIASIPAVPTICPSTTAQISISFCALFFLQQKFFVLVQCQTYFHQDMCIKNPSMHGLRLKMSSISSASAPTAFRSKTFLVIFQKDFFVYCTRYVPPYSSFHSR